MDIGTSSNNTYSTHTRSPELLLHAWPAAAAQRAQAGLKVRGFCKELSREAHFEAMRKAPNPGLHKL